MKEQIIKLSKDEKFAEFVKSLEVAQWEIDNIVTSLKLKGTDKAKKDLAELTEWKQTSGLSWSELIQAVKLVFNPDMYAKQNKYHKESMVQVAIRFHAVNDADVIDMIKSQRNQADYIRKLVLKDIEEFKTKKYVIYRVFKEGCCDDETYEKFAEALKSYKYTVIHCTKKELIGQTLTKEIYESREAYEDGKEALSYIDLYRDGKRLIPGR